MLGGVTGNEGSEWLVDFVVFLGFVHSADVVEDVFVDHGVCLRCALSEEELVGADWDEDALARRTMLLHMHFLRR